MNAPFVKPPTRLTAMAFPVFAACCQWFAKAVSGPATTLIASPPQRPDGAALLTQRVILQAAARDARNLRRAKLASLIEGELRDLTTDILRRGPHNDR